MGRRNQASTSLNSSRVRKISLQNDYAFGIISPVSSATLPVPIPLGRCTSDEIRIPCVLVHPWQVERRRSSVDFDPNDPDVDIGIDPLSLSGLSNTPNNISQLSSSERFRRWSFSNLQSAFTAKNPSGTEVSSQFTSDDEDYMISRRNNIINGSYANLRIGQPGCSEDKWISDLITGIPERIRKISTEKKPTNSETNIYRPDEDLKQQLKKVYVY